jgi:proteasome lid subunit RPN8/RPN11
MPITIKIPSSVVDEIIEYSLNAYPNEFFAFVEGKVNLKGVVKIKNLAYYPNDTSQGSVSTVYHMGTHTADFVGTCHSHPKGDNHPSRQDLRTFGHDGVCHFIIKSPYKKENLKCFGLDGKELGFEIV